MPNRAARLAALASHPRTRPAVAVRIRSSLRRARLRELAGHPRTSPAVAERINTALGGRSGR
ncbi:MAG: hypothetical protein ACRDY7_13705 [Acidimicrobiia bacterium]